MSKETQCNLCASPAVNEAQKALYEEEARVLKALAHPTRLLILDVLQKGERCVCEILPLIDSDKSTVSKHLSLLKNAGFIQDRREGTRLYYSLACSCVDRFFQSVRQVINTNFERQKNIHSAGAK